MKMEIKLEKDDGQHPRRFYTVGENGKVLVELIKMKISIDGRPVYQKGLNNSLLDSCKLAAEVFLQFHNVIYLIHNDRDKPCKVDGDLTAFGLEQFLLE